MSTLIYGSLNQTFKTIGPEFEVICNIINIPPNLAGSPMGKWLKQRFVEHVALEERLKLMETPQGKYTYENMGRVTQICMCLPCAEQVLEKTVNLKIKDTLSDIANQMRLSGKKKILLPFLGGCVMHLMYTEFAAMIDVVFPESEGFEVYIFSSEKYAHLHLGPIRHFETPPKRNLFQGINTRGAVIDPKMENKPKPPKFDPYAYGLRPQS